MNLDTVSLGWLDMLKEDVLAKHPDGTTAPIYVYGLRCGSPEAIARWEELARGK